MRIYIIGMPGTGKTHFGRGLARSLRLQFYDMDEYLEKQEGMPVRQIITEKGETYFRQIEHKAMETLSKSKNSIISCGGGTPVFFNHIDLMKQTGVVIWLNTDLNIIAKRIAQNSSRRPQFTGLSGTDLQQKLAEIFENRRKIYAKADIISEVNTPGNNSLSTVIQKVMKFSRRRNE